MEYAENPDGDPARAIVAGDNTNRAYRRCMSIERRLDVTQIPFRLRGIEGSVTVEYGVNEDPRRWGYEDLDLDWYHADLIRGFPVMQACVDHPREGYSADLGWIQVVKYVVRDPGAEEDATVFDVPPQFADSNVPYLAFGVRPTAFDAPAIGADEVTWRASTFLVYTPDAVLSRVSRPLCGFAWGYDVVAGTREVKPLEIAEYDRWVTLLPDLRGRYPDWDFQDVPW